MDFEQVALAAVGVRLFDLATQDVGRPYWIQFTFDGQVFGYLAAICLVTAVASGLARRCTSPAPSQ